MELFTELDSRVAALRDLVGEIGDAQALPDAVAGLGDTEVMRFLEDSTDLARLAERMKLAAAGVVARRSTREAGHAGLAQRQGHRNAVSLVQQVTGSTRADAARQARVGESMFLDRGTAAPSDRTDHREPAVESWRAPLQRSLLEGSLTAAQYEAISSGLGEPPTEEHGDSGSPASSAIATAWREAAEALIDEAPQRTVEDLRQTALALRDRLDPDGAEARFLAKHEARSFRVYTDREGIKRGTITFDDENAAWLTTVISMALRPRRGGPRFVDPRERQRAEQLAEDPRTNDQLAYDLILDLLRAGSIAEAETVFGTRQAGLRLVQVVDRHHRPTGVAHTEDGGTTLPSAVASQHTCNSGTVTVTVDSNGDPLNVGREQRLFTSRQRIALALRDGGCRWNGCDRPASYCEAHHIDEWSADAGRTDIDRGILLCRFHHMQLHHRKWRISRRGREAFILHDPGGETVRLRSRPALTAAWRSVDRPPPRTVFPGSARDSGGAGGRHVTTP